MRPVGNFHPEWGYLAPAPSFIRTARVVLVAAAIGATAGAAVVLSLTERPAAETSVSARTVARPVETASPPVSKQQAVESNTPHTTPQPNTPPANARVAARSQLATASPDNAAASESSVSATAQPPTSVAAMAEVPAAIDAAPAKAANPAPATARAPLQPLQAPLQPLQKKAIKKPHAQSRYASRSEQAYGDRGAFRLFDDQSLFGANGAADEYYPHRGHGGTYYREQRWGDYYPQRWGGYYLDQGFSYR